MLPVRGSKAFTLLELIVVIVILGILAAIAVPTFQLVIDRSKDQSAQQTLAAVLRNASALAAVRGDGVYTEQDFADAVAELPASASAPGLAAASWSVTTGFSGAYGVVAVAFSPDGKSAGVAMRSATGNCALGLGEAASVEEWGTDDLGAACTGETALAGPDAPPPAFKDGTPPAAPTGLTGVAGAGEASLSWTPPADVDVTGYQVFQDGSKTPVAAPTSTSTVVTGLTAGTEYSFTVAAVDGAGNVSPLSNVVKVTPTAAGPWLLSGSTPQPLGRMTNPSLSGNGAFVVFTSAASNLVPGDTNDGEDVFLLERSTGAVSRVNVTSAGAQSRPIDQGASDGRFRPSVSSDGRFVAFASLASDLDGGDTGITSDVFLRDRAAGTTKRLSFTFDGSVPNNPSHYATISADGSTVVFTSAASNLVSGDTNGYADLFAYDVSSGALTRLATAGSSAQPNYDQTHADLSANGRFVAFSSYASNLVAGDSNSATDMFRFDRSTGETIRVSLTYTGAQDTANYGMYYPSISADGSRVAWDSGSSQLAPGDTNNYRDVFLRDVTAGTTTRVSLASGGEQATGGESTNVELDGSGTRLAFLSAATNLVAGDTNNSRDVFVKDLASGAVTRVSTAPDGSQPAGNAGGVALSGDASVAAFSTVAPLLPGDTGGVPDLFVHAFSNSSLTRVMGSNASGASSDSAYGPRALSLSGNGRFAAFLSGARNLVPGDTNQAADIFVRDHLSGLTERVNLSPSGAEDTANYGVGDPTISDDARFVVYSSGSWQLVPGDTNSLPDVFRLDRTTGTTTRISLTSTGGQYTGGTHNGMIPAASADTSVVAFRSDGTDLVPGDTNGVADVFVRDVTAGTTRRVSLHASGAQATVEADYHGIDVSPDGRWVVWSTAASLVAADTNAHSDVYAFDLSSNALSLVSVSTTGTGGNDRSFVPRVAAGKVSFYSNATDLVAGETALGRVYVRDLAAGTTVVASLSETGVSGQTPGYPSPLSDDGRYVAFSHYGSTPLVAGAGSHENVYVRDLVAGTTRLVSAPPAGGATNGYSRYPTFSGDGSKIGFGSTASNLVAGDVNGFMDAFLASRP